MHRKGMPELVRTRPGSTFRWFHLEFAEQLPQCRRRRLDGQQRGIHSQEERGRIGTPIFTEESLTGLDVAAQFVYQVVANGDDTSSPLTVLDHQIPAVEVDIFLAWASPLAEPHPG